MKTTTQLITIKDVAERLKIAPNTVYRLCNRNGFPAKIKVGGAVRFDESDIEEWIECQKAGRKYIQRKGKNTNVKIGKDFQ